MKYQYNYSFLNEWLKANPEIPKGEILQALGAKSNNRFKAWVRCEGPMPVLSMLRLCNAYQIPLSAFFRDADAGTDGAIVPGMPTSNDRLEPAQGYADNMDDRQHGERSMLNPMDVQIAPSVVPGAVKKDEGTTTQKDGSIIKDVVVGNISDENMKRILEIEAKHTAQQNRLLDIIADQQRQINDLISLLHKTQDGNNNMPYDMAADSVMMR